LQTNKYNFSQFGNETWNFVKQPLKWDGIDLLKIGMIGAGTFLLMETADKPARTAVLKDNRYSNSFPIKFGTMWGELYFTEALFGGLSVYALYSGDKTVHKIAFEIAQATFYTFLVNGVLKIAIGRARPYLGLGDQTYKPFSRYDNADHQSLPSGHIGIVMALTTVLSRNAKPTWLKVLAYVPAALSVVGRVYLDKHWTSDVFMGGAIGYLISTWVVDQHEKSVDDDGNKSQIGVHDINIRPYLSHDSFGFGLSLHL
jgi:membrane-associated phospholipid phosphatase